MDAKRFSEAVFSTINEEKILSWIYFHLNEREEKVLKMRFGLAGFQPQTFREIAEEFSISIERVRQILHTACRKLRESMRGPSWERNRSVDELELSVHSYNFLRDLNIQTLGELLDFTEDEFSRERVHGNKIPQKVVKEIKVALLKHCGFSFRPSKRSMDQ